MPSSEESEIVDDELPPIDERLALPGAGYEIIDGRVMFVPPADPPHAERHSKVSALVEAAASPAFMVTSDMLTRTSKLDDIAPDVSVHPRDPDPETGGRRLEHLTFEIVSTTSRSRATTKARKLANRGVRRVFLIDIKRDCALEWSREHDDWRLLDPGQQIEDPALAAPLSVDALLHSATVDDELARALLVKRNPVIEAMAADAIARGRTQGEMEGRVQGQVEGRVQGQVEGRAEAIVRLLVLRGLDVPEHRRQQILSERDLARLDAWLHRAATCATVAELFDADRASDCP